MIPNSVHFKEKINKFATVKHIPGIRQRNQDHGKTQGTDRKRQTYSKSYYAA